MKSATVDLKELDKIIGKNLLKLRRIKGLTQQQLANFSGITFQQIQKYEKGTNKISAARLWQFAEIFHFQIDSLYSNLPGAKENHVLSLTEDQISIIKQYDRLRVEKQKMLKCFLRFLECDKSD